MNYTSYEDAEFLRICYLSLEDAEKLTTPRLLSYYKKIKTFQFRRGTKRIVEYAQKLKQILDSRPHVPRKPSKNEQNRIDFQKMLKKFNYEKIS